MTETEIAAAERDVTDAAADVESTSAATEEAVAAEITAEQSYNALPGASDLSAEEVAELNDLLGLE